MEPQIIIARRIARELSSGMLVNLGIGIPTLVANYVPEGMHVFFQSENGLIGTGAPPEEGMAHPTLTDAGGPSGDGAAGRQHVRQRNVVRPHSRWPSRSHGSGRPAGRSGRAPGQLDDPQEDGAGHGRGHGSGVRRQARHRGDAAHRQGRPEDREEMHAASSRRRAPWTWS